MLFDEKDYNAALVTYNLLIQEFPERKEGYFNRALCLYKTEKYAESIFDFEESFALDTLLREARLMKGFAFEKQGNLKEAMSVYESLLITDATLFPLKERIKNYHTAVFISKSWYYMVAIFLVVIILIAVVAKSLSYRKG